MKTVINIKTDKEVKRDAKKIAEELGLPLSTIINAYLKEFIRDQEINFSMEPQIRPEIGKLLEGASADFKKKRNVSTPFSSAKEMDKYLDTI
jgi:addiction module RelB/DinJ family antitoxin